MQLLLARAGRCAARRLPWPGLTSEARFGACSILRRVLTTPGSTTTTFLEVLPIGFRAGRIGLAILRLSSGDVVLLTLSECHTLLLCSNTEVQCSILPPVVFQIQLFEQWRRAVSL
jgi:hypothetical protein